LKKSVVTFEKIRRNEETDFCRQHGSIGFVDRL
jgi:hypothetical protein